MRRFHRPRLLALETRTTPAVILWDGGAGTFNWADAANWSGDQLPLPTDEAVIDSAFAGITVTSTGTVTIEKLTCAATLQLAGGTFTLSSGTAASTTAKLTHNTGTLDVAGTLTITDTWQWTAGIVRGLGTVVLSAGATATLSSSGNRFLALTLDNSGAITNRDAVLRFGHFTETAPAVLVNQAGASLTFEDDAGTLSQTANPGHAIVNSGTLVHTQPSTASVTVPVTNAGGAVQIAAGGLSLVGGITFTADSAVTAGALDISGVALNVAAGVTVTGNLRLAGAPTLSLAAGSSIPAGLTQTAGTVAPAIDPSANLPTYTLSGGTLNLTTLTLPAFTQNGGFLDVSGTLTVTTTWAFTGGHARGGGTLALPATATGLISGGGNKFLALTLANFGVITYRDSAFRFGSTFGGGPGIVINQPGATFTFEGLASTLTQTVDPGHAIVNKGTLAHTLAGISTITVPFTNTGGTIQMPAGALQLVSGGTFSGTSTIAAGTLELSGGAFTVAAGGTLTGSVRLSGATGITLDAGAAIPAGITQTSGNLTATVDATASLPSFTLSGGTLNLATLAIPAFTQTGGTVDLTGTLTVTGNWLWTAGLVRGAGTLTIPGSGSGLIADPGGVSANLAVTLDNFGSISCTQAGMRFGGGSSTTPGTLLNRAGATFTLENNADITFAGAASHSITNSGTLAHTLAGTSTISVPVINAGGTAHVPAGVLSLFGGVTFTGASAVTAGTLEFGGGAVTVAANATVTGSLRLSGATGLTLAAGSSVPAGFTQSSGILTPTLDPTANLPAYTLAGGTLNLATRTFASFSQTGGILDVGGTVTVTSNWVLTLGQMRGAGLFVLAPGATGAIANASASSNAMAVTFDNFGSITCSLTGLRFGGGSTTTPGTLTNHPEATFTLDGTAEMSIAGSAVHAFINKGTFRHTQSGTSPVSVPFTNDGGVIDVVAGTLSIANPVALNGGMLRGNGTLSAAVTNADGSVRPGASPGRVTVNGSYVQSGSGELRLEINGKSPITQHDQLAVNGSVALGGPLALTLGYFPAAGDSFTVIANDLSDAVTGTFDGLPEGAVANVNGVRLQITYKGGTGNDVVLTRLPGAIALVTVDDGSPQRSRVRSLTVTFTESVNLPANPADAFVLTRTGPGTPTGTVDLTVDTSTSTATQTVAKLTFSGTLTDFTSLRDGQYTLSVIAAQVTDGGGQPIDGDGDGLPGGNGAATLHRLFGDLDGDADVDAADFGAFRQAFGAGGFVFDFDNDGDVDAADFGQFRQRFGSSV